MIKNRKKKARCKQAAIQAALAMASSPVIVDLAGLNDALGGFDARVKIRQAVEERLLTSPELARHWEIVIALGDVPHYDMVSFGFNVECVEQDAKLGRIKKPEAEQEWIDALVTEYVANAQAAAQAGMDSDFGKWLATVEEELGDDPSEAAVQTLLLIRRKRNEAANGTWQTLGGEVSMPNADLCGLVFLAIAENHLHHLAEDEDRGKDSARHLEAYTKAVTTIYSDRFSEEEQGLAWMVLD